MPFSKGQLVRSKETGWTGVVTMAGKTIVQVRFIFETFNGKPTSMKSAWRVSDLEAVA